MVSFFVCACSHAQPKEGISSQYNVKIAGLFIEGGAGPICQIQASFDGDLNGSIRRLWVNRDGIRLLVTSIEKEKGGVRVVFASPEVCSPEGVDSVRERIMKYFGHISIAMAPPLELFDYTKAHERLGLLDINASNFASGTMGQCKIDREFKKEISYEDLIDIRYSMSIPLVFYLHSGSREFLAFDSNCEFKDDFVKLIDMYF